MGGMPVRKGQRGREQPGIAVPESRTGLPEGQPALRVGQSPTTAFGPVKSLGRQGHAEVGRPLTVSASEQDQPSRVLRRGSPQLKSELAVPFVIF